MCEVVQELCSNGAGTGLRGLRERISELGGKLEIDSAGVGKGTTVTAELPCVSRARGATADQTDKK